MCLPGARCRYKSTNAEPARRCFPLLPRDGTQAAQRHLQLHVHAQQQLQQPEPEGTVLDVTFITYH